MVEMLAVDQEALSIFFRFLANSLV
jgi:hypothetical protein